jgi:nucleotide-binding universal stress UspA family protein
MMRILVATDGSPHPLRAAEVAARLARELREAELLLINVGHIPAVALAGPGPDAMINLSMIEEALESAGKAILDQTQRVFAGIAAPVARVYRRGGDPSTEILKAGEEAHADLIVMGSRGLGQIGGLILGSVREHVLHGAHTPVLVVRRSADEQGI